MKNRFSFFLIVWVCGFSILLCHTTFAQPASELKVLDYGYGSSDAATVTIGGQTWISKNLNVDHFANGEVIPEAKTIEEWIRAGENEQPAWCYYNNDKTNMRAYGKLYNWYAVNDLRGLAPQGWHIPSDTEWATLTDYLGGETMAGLKIKNTKGWNEKGNGNNASGIAGLPGGDRDANGRFYLLGECGYWWSSSEDTGAKAIPRYVYYYSDKTFSLRFSKGCGFSVRCLRD